jgi:hypothetical protein
VPDCVRCAIRRRSAWLASKTKQAPTAKSPRPIANEVQGLGDDENGPVLTHATWPCRAAKQVGEEAHFPTAATTLPSPASMASTAAPTKIQNLTTRLILGPGRQVFLIAARGSFRIARADDAMPRLRRRGCLLHTPNSGGRPNRLPEPACASRIADTQQDHCEKGAKLARPPVSHP